MDLREPALDCWYLTGPTASGKTSIGVELAERLGAEIISLDSMALYRGMDIGTAKPSADDRQRVTHHLVDLLEPNEDFSISDYTRRAHETIAEIRSRGREVLFVGGTSLYLKAMLRGLDPGPPADWEFRREVDAEVERVGIEALHERLRQVDPLSAAKLHPHDKRRIIRALEVFRATGQPISHRQMQFDEGAAAERCRVFALFWPRAELHRRIETRVDRMFAEGLVDEVRGLLARFGSISRTATQAVGYREALAHLEQHVPLDRTIETVKARTRQFARRQETWFRSLSECRRVAMTPDATPAEVAERIVADV